ncbi:MAG: hypothetical protein ACM34N_05305 [Ignavibacteria bacterium]
MDNKELIIKNNPITVQTGELSIEEIVSRQKKILEIQKNLMREGVHFGKTPGTDKKCLFKPGAEILQTAFMLACIAEPENIQVVDMPNNHREVRVYTKIIHYPTGMVLGVGFGSCSTMEKKYRYRKQSQDENTGKYVPKEYWDLKKAERFDEAIQAIGGKGFSVKKIDNSWMIVKKGNETLIENPDIADCYNTVLKMAKKRADVCAVIAATGCSDIYNQDLDDTDLMTDKDLETGNNKDFQQVGDSDKKNIWDVINKIPDSAEKIEIAKELRNKSITEERRQQLFQRVEELLKMSTNLDAAADAGFNEQVLI